MQDTDFDYNSEEERLQQQQEQELLRKIRREVRRVRSGEADDQMREEEELERQEQQEREAEEERQRRRHSSWLWQMFSGSILVRSGVSRYYKYALAIAVMFFLSILTIFNALRLDKQFTQVESRTQLLRERSIRMQERRYRLTTHSAIVRRLKERGIDLQDANNTTEIIE